MGARKGSLFLFLLSSFSGEACQEDRFNWEASLKTGNRGLCLPERERPWFASILPVCRCLACVSKGPNSSILAALTCSTWRRQSLLGCCLLFHLDGDSHSQCSFHHLDHDDGKRQLLYIELYGPPPPLLFLYSFLNREKGKLKSATDGHSASQWRDGREASCS